MASRSTLLSLIDGNKWDEVSERIKSNPEELKIKSSGHLPIHWACQKKFAPLDVITGLLDAYPDGIKIRARRGNLPLHYAATEQLSIAVIEQLIHRYPEAASQARDDGCLPVHCAVRTNNASLAVVKRLLKAFPKGIKTKVVSTSRNRIPLHLAAMFHCPPNVIDALVAAYPEGLWQKDSEGLTPRKVAERYYRPLTAKYLKEKEKKEFGITQDRKADNEAKESRERSGITTMVSDNENDDALPNHPQYPLPGIDCSYSSCCPGPSGNGEANRKRNYSSSSNSSSSLNDGNEVSKKRQHQVSEKEQIAPNDQDEQNVKCPMAPVKTKQEDAVFASNATAPVATRVPKFIQQIEKQEAIWGIKRFAEHNLHQRLAYVEEKILGKAQDGGLLKRVQKLIYKDDTCTSTWLQFLEETEVVWCITPSQAHNALQRLETIEETMFQEVKNGGIAERLKALYDAEP